MNILNYTEKKTQDDFLLSEHLLKPTLQGSDVLALDANDQIIVTDGLAITNLRQSKAVDVSEVFLLYDKFDQKAFEELIFVLESEQHDYQADPVSIVMITYLQSIIHDLLVDNIVVFRTYEEAGEYMRKMGSDTYRSNVIHCLYDNPKKMRKEFTYRQEVAGWLSYAFEAAKPKSYLTAVKLKKILMHFAVREEVVTKTIRYF